MKLTLMLPALGVILTPTVALSQYAQPPDAPLVAAPCNGCSDGYGDGGYPDGGYGYDRSGAYAPVAGEPAPRSTFRVTTGPAVRLSPAGAAGGLGVALEVGQGAAGVRAGAAWLGVGEELGLAQYTGELWLDFGTGSRLHPVLGAGGGAARVELVNATGDLEASLLGIGALRAALMYALPVRDTDARCGIDVTGVLPAIRGSSTPSVDPWLLALATVTVGF